MPDSDVLVKGLFLPITLIFSWFGVALWHSQRIHDPKAPRNTPRSAAVAPRCPRSAAPPWNSGRRPRPVLAVARAQYLHRGLQHQTSLHLSVGRPHETCPLTRSKPPAACLYLDMLNIYPFFLDELAPYLRTADRPTHLSLMAKIGRRRGLFRPARDLAKCAGGCRPGGLPAVVPSQTGPASLIVRCDEFVPTRLISPNSELCEKLRGRRRTGFVGEERCSDPVGGDAQAKETRIRCWQIRL